MSKQANTKNQSKTAKRSFARLDRDQALHAAAGPVGLLRKIFNDAPRAAGYALERVEAAIRHSAFFEFQTPAR